MATKTDISSQQDAASQRSGSLMRRLLFGQVVSSDFFARNWLGIVLGVFIMLAYISGKYSCQRKMEEVRRLTREYEVVSAEMVRTRSSYMSEIRESSMQAMVDSFHLGLSVQENPPYRLHADK